MPSKIRGGTADKHLADMHIPRVSALGAGGGAAFTPSDIAGLQLWLQPSNVAQADNTAISSVTMSVGGNATQGTGGAQPTWQTNELNGYGVIRYDGGDFLSTSVSAATKPVTRFAVVKATDFTDDRTIFGSSVNGGLQFRLDATTGKMHVIKQGTNDIWMATTGVGTSWVILAITYSNVGSVEFFLSGASDSTGTNNFSFTASTLLLGNSSAADEPFLGDIAELLQYDTVLSGTDLDRVGGYLATKYGLTWT